MTPSRQLQAHRTRSELGEWIERFRFELAAEGCPRCVPSLGRVCALLLERLVSLTGETQETTAYQVKLELMDREAKALWDEGPVLTLVSD